MPPETSYQNLATRRILGRIAPQNFVDRLDALRQIIDLTPHNAEQRGLLLLAAPSAGVTELLRQSYDVLFQQRGGAAPVYFAWTRRDQTMVGAARRFLYTFLLQLVAHRRNDPTLVEAPPPMRDLVEFAVPADLEWMERLVESYERARTGGDERALVHLCLNAPQQAAQRGVRSVIILDDVHIIEQLDEQVDAGTEIAQVLASSDVPFVLAGLRRRLLDIVHGAQGHTHFDRVGMLHLELLSDSDARDLVARLASSQRVTINDECRDLLVQQFNGNPFFIAAMIQAAQNRRLALTSFLDCQKLYVDELLGGRINRHFNSVLEEVAPALTTRRAMIRVLHESAASAGGKSPAEAWRKKLDLDADELQHIMRGLHMYELASFNATYVEIGGLQVWRDYLRASYRLQVSAEPRALVVAETLLETLKRAPQTMARHYRRQAALNLRQLLGLFNNQRVPASLLHDDRFKRMYKGTSTEVIATSLDAETDLVRLPQIVHTASCASFHPPLQQVCDEDGCVVAHGFDSTPYTDAHEVVWLTAEIESKLEAGRALTEMWCDRLSRLAHACGFHRVRLWLVSPEGFSAEANELLNERGAFGSSGQQLELLTARLSGAPSPERGEDAPNEFEMVIPMGGDTELISAQTVEHIARRLNFQPEAINQIKTALIEACINAGEHSLSPDRKIYQRFRVESDKLVITISSRGILPSFTTPNGERMPEQNNGNDGTSESNGRRSWGLKLIRTLMDEVEFELVDDGTRLRMTKYLRR